MPIYKMSDFDTGNLGYPGGQMIITIIIIIITN